MNPGAMIERYTGEPGSIQKCALTTPFTFRAAWLKESVLHPGACKSTDTHRGAD
jgi:hypothetical protein